MSTANENDNFRFSRNFYEHYFCFQADERKCRDEELSEAFPPILSEFDLGLDEILIPKAQSFLISICETIPEVNVGVKDLNAFLQDDFYSNCSFTSLY